MTREEFERVIAEEFEAAIPERFIDKIKNVVFVAEEEPSRRVREEEGLRPDETLLGFYQGIPATARGDGYGVGAHVPDVITLYRIPIEEEAKGDIERIREVVRETLWHEVAHYFGLDEGDVESRERTRRTGDS